MLNLQQAKDASIPLRICGIFIDEMFKHSDIVKCSPHKCSDKDRLMYPACSRHSLLYSTCSMEVLHSALNFSLAELMSVIVRIYDGRLPQPYEFFRCHENTTMHQLKLFLTRAINHPLTFMILGVNLLPVKLQEVKLRHKIPALHMYYVCNNIFCCRWYSDSMWNFTHPVIIKSNHVFTIWKRCHPFCMKCHGFNKKSTMYVCWINQ